MPQFLIKATDEQGRALQQVEQGASAQEVRERLRQQGYWVYTVRPQQAWRERWREKRKQLPASQLLLFTQQFMTLVKAGLPILRALELLESRARDQRLRELLQEVHLRVKAGEQLSEFFFNEPGITDIYTTTLLARERSGNLPEVLGRYVQYQRLALSVRRKLISSLIYPAVLLVLVVFVLSFLVTYVVPRFGQLYDTLGAKLPALTVAMLAIGDFARHYFVLAVLALIAAIAGLGLAARTDGLRQRLDAWMLRLPLVGEMWWKYQIAVLSRTLATLLESGIPVMSAIETAGTAIQSLHLRLRWRRMLTAVREGKPLAESMAKQQLAPPLAVEMVEVGEQTGALPQMLSSLAEFYDDDLSTALTAILSLIEPVILLLVGSLVALVLIALYLPIFSLGSSARLGGGH